MTLNPSAINNATSSKNPEANFTKKALQGAFLGFFKAVLITPLLYYKNMLQSGNPIVVKNCVNATFVIGLNIIPQFAGTLGFRELLTKKYYKKQSAEELTERQQLMTTGLAAAGAGFLTVPGEFIAQNRMNKWQSTTWKVIVEAHRIGGYRVFFRGAVTVPAREFIYMNGLFYLSKKLSIAIQPIVKNENYALVIGGAFAGAITGAITNPIDVLRANRQCMLKGWSYIQTMQKVGPTFMIKGIRYRSAAIAVAISFLSAGNKYFEKREAG